MWWRDRQPDPRWRPVRLARVREVAADRCRPRSLGYAGAAMVGNAQLRELGQYAHLIFSFARRDLRARYRQALLGMAWAVFQPFSLMIVMTFVFSRLARISSDGLPYPIFVYTGLIFWTFFASSVSRGTMAIVANANLVRKIYFPRETLLLAVLLEAGLDLLLASTMLGAMLVYARIALGWIVLWVAPLLALQLVFTAAVMCVLSAVEVHFRDVGHAVPLGLQLAMFVSPVAYPLSAVPERFLPLYALNPMASIIDGYRRVILLGVAPDLSHLALALVVSLVAAGLGYALFKRAERTFADVI